jgi:aminocarboxymuconate-semialdehyde decarboxylase
VLDDVHAPDVAREHDIVVDLHTHFMPPDLPDHAASTGDPRWPRLVLNPDGTTGQVLRGQDVFRIVRKPCWDSGARIAEMDRLGVDIQVISPIPVSLTYWAEPAPALAYARHINDWVAQAVAGSGGRLLGLGTVPLQHPDIAISELVRAVVDLGLTGLEIGTLAGPFELDALELRPFFETAQELSVPLFVHPTDTHVVPRARSADFAFGIGMHTDTALAAGALILGGVLREYPRLHVCLSHGGGALPWVLPRLKFGRSLSDPDLAWQVDELASRLYVDSLVFDPAHLRLLRTRFGVGHIVAGSDYPFLPGGLPPHEILRDAVRLGVLSADEMRAIQGTNALQFLFRSDGTARRRSRTAEPAFGASPPDLHLGPDGRPATSIQTGGSS